MSATNSRRRRSTHTTAPPLTRCLPAVEKLEWSQPLAVLRYPHPKLRAVNARIGVFDERLAELARQMFDVMYT